MRTSVITESLKYQEFFPCRSNIITHSEIKRNYIACPDHMSDGHWRSPNNVAWICAKLLDIYANDLYIHWHADGKEQKFIQGTSQWW